MRSWSSRSGVGASGSSGYADLSRATRSNCAARSAAVLMNAPFGMRTLFGPVERQPGPYDAKSRAPPRLLIRSGQLTVPPTTRPYVVKTVAIEFFTEVCRLKGDAEGYVLCRKAFDSCEIRSQISLW